ncbi:alpha/beta hydrolase [Amycolatopsis acidicola]|uniref:Alpha/beta hydrolase n=1 Tax=Amycolatopsis acidicola TaxID=2596893 RepID=A0A5N0UNF9_9PSEU|nr:alpha/beta hydrolase [Amycolatopsis acidicola]
MHEFAGHDGVPLAYRETGAGRPLILLHGLTADAPSAWIATGHAETIAARGHRVIMPDLRGHGKSARPHDPAAYPRDILAHDGLALVRHLGLTGYDLGGYSLGGRVVVRMLVRGATPGRAIIGGQGMRQVAGERGGAGDAIRRIAKAPAGPGSPDWETAQRLRESGADLTALVHVLDSLVPTTKEEVAAIRTPALVVAGAQDSRAASVEELAAALPDATHAVLPGGHWGAAVHPGLATTMAGFLDGH